MVFWRLGVRRLPSSEAFTKIAHADVRINFNELSSRLGALPEDYQRQSALWYARYRKHMKETAVTDANAAYLLYREMTAIMPVVLLIVLIGGMTTHTDWLRIFVCCFGACAEYLLVMMAARNAGTRLVANVLAIEGASLKQTAAETPKVPVSRAPRSGWVPRRGKCRK